MQASMPLPEDFTLDTILTHFSTDEKARTFLETWLWPNGPTCARCGTNDQARIAKTKANKQGGTRPGLYRCNDCRRTFTVTVGTIFEDSHIPLRKWLVGWFLIASSKKGISALQLQRILDIGSYRTAHFLTHRIRHALKPAAFADKLTGTVEIDETWVGGKTRIQFKNGKMTTAFSNKTPVVSLVERGGTKRSMVVERVNATTLRAAIVEHTAKDVRAMTDDSRLYSRLNEVREHHSVNHSRKQYALKKDGFTAHTNTVESSFSLLKRGIIGAFHSVSKKYLPLYLAEFDHRWNMRKETDGERCVDGIQKARGKRLTYRAIKNPKS
jgi:transposase-like protein